MAEKGDFTRDQLRLVGNYLERGLRLTHARLRDIGLQEDALLDPEEGFDRQVAILRGIYLQAEKSALAFDDREGTFWQVLRARLQPVALAYLTHAKFMQSLDQQSREIPHDVLLDVYRERLEHSARFRHFFFELNERFQRESVNGSVPVKDSLAAPSSHSDQALKVAGDSASIQGNVLKMLEKQLRDLEKAYNRLEETHRKASEEILSLKDDVHTRDGQLASLETRCAQFNEDNVALRLALDAQNRSERAAEPRSAGQRSLLTPERFVDAEKSDLLRRIDAMEQELATTSDAAYNAFMASSDLGIVILFMLTSFRCHSQDQLAQELARAISAYGVKVVVGYRDGNDMQYVGSAGADLSLKSVLDLHRSKGPLVEANHLMLYGTHCCLLVQEPPRTDEERYDRMKDNLGTLLRGMEARYEAIEAASAVQRQKNQVEQLILRSHEVFQTFEKNLNRQQDRMGRTLGLFAQELRKNLGIPPGDQTSIRLNMVLKKLEETLRGLFKSVELIDPAFTRNITRVAQGIQSKQKPPDTP